MCGQLACTQLYIYTAALQQYTCMHGYSREHFVREDAVHVYVKIIMVLIIIGPT